MPTGSTSRWGSDGCGFTIATCVFTCLFLVVNGIVLTIAYRWLAPSGPAWLMRPKVEQFILFIGPVLLIFLQWTLIDTLAHRLFAGRKR